MLDVTFKNHGWRIINDTKNTKNKISYTKPGYETDSFDIHFMENDYIKVSIPMKNLPYHYVTTFTNYNQATDYVKQRFFDYIEFEFQ